MVANDDERMGAFDAVMWGVESDPLLRSVIVVMAVLDREPDLARGVARVERMTRAVPQLRQRVVGNPMSLVPPRWETDPHFDLSYHLRWYEIPHPDGTLRPALAVAEQLAEQDFDRSRPLWEMVLLTGLPHGGAALLVKLHHAITDGVGGMAMAASLFDLGRDADLPADTGPQAPDPDIKNAVERIRDGVGYGARSVVGGVRTYGTGAVRLGARMVSHPVGSVQEGTAYLASAQRLLAPASTPRSELMTGRSLSVHFSLVERPLAELKAAAKASGGTVNDAFLAAVTLGLGRYHRDLGDVGTSDLRINMPVNLRPAGEATAGGNQWVPARILLPIAPRDPQAQVRALSPLLKAARSEPALPVSDFVMRRLTQLPRPVTTAIAGGLMKGTDVAATNVPGPPVPVYLAGAEVQRLVPFAPKAGAAVNVALMSYRGVAQLGINTDTAAVPDPEVLVEALSTALDDVLALGRADAAPRRVTRPRAPRTGD